jgi:CheY-like chemotaxis protein
LLRHAIGPKAAPIGKGPKGVNGQRMELNKSPASSAPPAGERQALALMLAGAGVEQALAALLQAFEHGASGVGVAVHARAPSGDGMRRKVWSGPLLAGFSAGVQGLPDDESPLCKAFASLQPVSVADGPGAQGEGPRWAACLALMRVHGVRRCRFEPLLDASGASAIGVLACSERGPEAAGAAELAGLAGLAGLAASVSLLLGHDQRMRQREHEVQQRRETLRMLAHDMRNLLAPLRTALEVLARPQVDLQALQRLRSIMSRQVAQLAELPDELSRLARSEFDDPLPDAGQLTLPTDDGQAGAEAPVAPVTPAASVAPAEPPPGAAAPADGAGPPTAHGTDGARCRVLVADDNEHVRASFVELLAAEGFEVRTAVDGEQAVEIAEEWEPDVVLLDIHMPRLSGLETARRLRATHPPQRMTLLMLSGMTLNDAWVRHAKAAGFDDCLDKSADPRAWLSRVRQRALH